MGMKKVSKWGRGTEAERRWESRYWLGMGKEDWSWDREGARKEVGQRPSWEQEDEGSKRKEGQASVTNAVQLLLVSDASSQVRQFCISTQLLQRHAAERMVVQIHPDDPSDRGINRPEMRMHTLYESAHFKLIGQWGKDEHLL